MEDLADTVTIIRHFTGAGRIGANAKEVLAAADSDKHHIFISVLSLVEIMYLSRKNRIRINLEETIDMVNGSDNYSVVDLDARMVMIAEYIEAPEIFDRLIIATARFLDVPLLTSDEAIRTGKQVRTIW